MTRSIAREFAPLNIRANVICPAMIETKMLDELSGFITGATIDVNCGIHIH